MIVGDGVTLKSTTEVDKGKCETLARLLADEEAKLAAICRERIKSRLDLFDPPMPTCRTNRPPKAVASSLSVMHECGVSIVASPIVLSILGDLKWFSLPLTSRRSSPLSPGF
jgi:hypothetical protein